MLRDSKFKRTDRQLLPSPPSINDFNHFLYAAQKLNGRWVDFSWKAVNGQMFTVSVSWSGAVSQPVWRLYGGDESRSLQWEHQSCDVPLVFNLVATHSGMNDRMVNAEKALSKTRGSLGEGEAHSQFYGFNETVQGALPAQELELGDLKNLNPEVFHAKVEESTQPGLTPQASGRKDYFYPEQFICSKTGLLTYQGFLFLLEREYELAKRTNLPLTLLLFSATPKPQKGSPDKDSEVSMLKVLPYIAIVQRKSDTLAHYKDGQLAMLLPSTSITGAKSAARRMLRALDKAEDPDFQSLRFSVAATDLINDAPSLDVVLTAAEETSVAARKSDGNVVAYRDVLLNMTADQLTNRLKMQQKLNAQAQTSRSALMARLRNEIISKTGLVCWPVISFFLEHDQKRALREKRSLTLLVLELAALPTSGRTLATSCELAMQEGLKSLTRIKRKVDILGEYEGNRIALILPDTSLTQVKVVTDRIKKTVREELIAKLGPTAELYISISAADVMDQYPNLNFRPI